MVFIQIFDLQKVGQGHELRRRIRGWIEFYGLEDDEKWRPCTLRP